MDRLPIPEPFSGGIFLSYKCSSTCKHCMYACSPKWSADWIPLEDAERILSQLARKMQGKYRFPGRIGVNEGIHFSGGEPFLNFDLLLQLTQIAKRLGIPSTFVETNCFWCTDDEATRHKLRALQQAGLDGILISANPFILEEIPFECTERAARVSREVFAPENVIVYQLFFFDQFRELGLKGTLALEDYLERAGYGLRYAELFANGRVPYKLGHLFQPYPARRFFSVSCQHELIRDWHIHVDNYSNFIPGYCAGLSLGDARDLDDICRGINLKELPILKALLTRLGDLYELGKQFGYEDLEGYVSKCHLCADLRRHLVGAGDFRELKPRAYYDRLED